MPWCSRTWRCLDIVSGRHRAGRRSLASHRGCTVLPAAWRQTASPVTHGDTRVRSSGAGCSWHELWHPTTERWGGFRAASAYLPQAKLPERRSGLLVGARSEPRPSSGQRGEQEEEYRQPLCPAPGLPTQRHARALTSPLQWPALQGHHSPSAQDEPGTGRDPLGGMGCLLSPIPPSYHPLCSASVPRSSHPGSPHSPQAHPCSLLAVRPMLSSALLQIQANTGKQQQA